MPLGWNAPIDRELRHQEWEGTPWAWKKKEDALSLTSTSTSSRITTLFFIFTSTAPSSIHLHHGLNFTLPRACTAHASPPLPHLLREVISSRQERHGNPSRQLSCYTRSLTSHQSTSTYHRWFQCPTPSATIEPQARDPERLPTPGHHWLHFTRHGHLGDATDCQFARTRQWWNSVTLLVDGLVLCRAAVPRPVPRGAELDGADDRRAVSMGGRIRSFAISKSLVILLGMAVFNRMAGKIHRQLLHRSWYY